MERTGELASALLKSFAERDAETGNMILRQIMDRQDRTSPVEAPNGHRGNFRLCATDDSVSDKNAVSLLRHPTGLCGPGTARAAR